MDSEEAREIEHHQKTGHPQTDEGPYYHESWWEAYKGGVKGLMGGIIIGAAVGAVVGLGATGLLSAVVGLELSATAVGALVAAFSGFGAYHAAAEFSHVGIVTGAVAAAHEKAEDRIKEFEDARFAELKREIRGLKATVEGKSEEEIQAAMASCEPQILTREQAEIKLEGYRTEHCDDHCEDRKMVFWKIAGIGAAIGAAGGALLGYSGLSTELLHPLEHVIGHVSPAQALGASTVIGGSVGASFGINRDLFRGVFDITDRWFRGIVMEDGSPDKTVAISQGLHQPDLNLTAMPMPEKRSATYFQDRINAEAAKQALLNLDHTTAVRH